jgi:hypothetical protein
MEIAGNDGTKEQVERRRRSEIDDAALAVSGNFRRRKIGIVVDEDPPTAVVDEEVVLNGVVTAAGEIDSGANDGSGGNAQGGGVGIVVVVDVVALDEGAGFCGVVGAGAVLRRRRIVVGESAGDDAGLVEVPLGVFANQVAAGVGARVALGAVLRVDVTENGIAVVASTDVEGGVRHIVA